MVKTWGCHQSINIHKWGFTDPWKGSLMMVGWLYFSMPCDDDGTYGMDTVYLDSFPPVFPVMAWCPRVFLGDMLGLPGANDEDRPRHRWWGTLVQHGSCGAQNPKDSFAAARLREEQGRLETYAGVAPSHSSILLLQLRTHRAGALWKESALGFLCVFFWAPFLSFFNDFCDEEVSVSISSMAPQVSFFQTQ